MEKQTTITLFAKLGDVFSGLAAEQPWNGFISGLTESEYQSMEELIRKEHIYNPWFTKESVLSALASISGILKKEILESWLEKHAYSKESKRVAIIMAGNIPLVGFHDLLAVIMSGNTAVCKLSSNDLRLLPAVVSILSKWNPEMGKRIEIAVGPLKKMDAVIATGSANSVSYFDHYFGKYPHIFRKNRTSVAVLDGTETDEELQALGQDMFRYFGLGCRNVSKLFIPDSFNTDRLFEAIVGFGNIINHHKYANNYDYNRTIYLMNSVPFLDNNFCILKEDEGLFSPLSVFFIQRYGNRKEVEVFLERYLEGVQTVVGHGFTPFGQGQEPAVDDYADGINTMHWLSNLA